MAALRGRLFEKEIHKMSAAYRKIVWIASYPKSGNTWFRAFLEAYILGDVDLNAMAASMSDDMAGIYAIGDGTKPHDLPIDLQYLTRPMAMLRLVRMHMQDEARNALPLFVKTHHPHLVVNGIELLPAGLTAAVVHIVRDPRDVLPSFAKHMGVDQDKATEWMQDDYRHLKGNEWRVSDLISSWDKHTASFLNADTHHVKTWCYEDLRADPVKHFAQMLEHSGIKPDMDRVAAAVDEVELGKLRAKEAKDGFKESSPHAKNQFFGAGQVGGWDNVVSIRNQNIICRKFGRQMKRLGYLDKRLSAVR